MNFFAPSYYKSFKCIADKCSHSCCIGWEIDIDDHTYERYSALCCGYGKTIPDTIDDSDVPHFILGTDERCPHLDERGLCKIITNLGEDYLCEICREHPRFYLDREVGLGMACEEACRIILASDEYDVFEETDIECDLVPELEFDAITERSKLFATLKNEASTYEERLHFIYSEYGVCLKEISDEDARDTLLSLEYLDENHKSLFNLYSADTKTPKELEKPLERALAYFIFRHCTQATDICEFRSLLGFALFCERLLCAVSQKLDNVELAARTVSEEIEYSTDNTEAIKRLF